MVPGVPMTPTPPPRVRRSAARAPGAMTPSTGTGSAADSAGSATAEAVLHATTSSLMPRSSRNSAFFSE